MKIKNIADSFEQAEVKSSKYSRCYYDEAEKLTFNRLGDVLTDSKYQYVIKESSTKEQIKAKLEKKISTLRCVDGEYIEKLRAAEAELCYFPIHYMRLDCYKYKVGFESACRSCIKEFGNKGKKDHFADLFSKDADQNKSFFNIKSQEGDDACKEKYSDLKVLASNDMYKVITFSEFKAEEGREVYAAEYQVLQTVYYPIWVVRVEFGGEERYTYISDCNDTVNMTIAYNQSMLEDIAHKIRKPRRFFWKLSEMKFYFWSWLIIAAICFFVGIVLNVDYIVKSKAISATKPIILSASISMLIHWGVYLMAHKVIGVNSETNPLIDGISIGEKRAEWYKTLFLMTLSVIPMVISIFFVLVDKF